MPHIRYDRGSADVLSREFFKRMSASPHIRQLISLPKAASSALTTVQVKLQNASCSSSFTYGTMVGTEKHIELHIPVERQKRPQGSIVLWQKRTHNFFNTGAKTLHSYCRALQTLLFSTFVRRISSIRLTMFQGR